MSPPKHAGLRHVALYVESVPRAADFYVGLLGFEVEWHPDPDNLYLCSGADNLALHKGEPGRALEGGRLDHIGIILRQAEDVDAWHEHLVAAGVEIVAQPKTHRDGARSFYCKDPDGTVVQLIHHPPIADA